MEMPVRTNAQNPTKKRFCRTKTRDERGPTHTPSHQSASLPSMDSGSGVKPIGGSGLRRRDAIPDLIFRTGGANATGVLIAWVAFPGPLDETVCVEPPAVEYARSGDVSIAYHVLGDGPIDLVFTTLFISTVFSAEREPFATFYRRLASVSRLILFDNGGTGASYRPRTAPTLEAQMDDVRAVLDAVGSQQAAIFGAGHGGLMCALFAATYPERTSALILYNGWARFPGTTDEHHALIRRFRDEWGRKETIERVIREQYPSLAGDREFFKAAAMVVRATASPGSAAEYMRTVTEADIGAVLPT